MTQQNPFRTYSQSGSYFGSFQGYPTKYNHMVANWEELCHGLCTIELSSPPAVILKNNGDLRVIQLRNGFDYVMQHKEAVLLTTSNEKSADMYGFAFVGEEKRESFEAALFHLKQYYTNLPLDKPIPLGDNYGIQDHRQDNINTGKRPDVRKRVPAKENLVERDPAKINDMISQYGNKVKEEDTLCNELSKSIEAGDLEKAKDIVTQLAKQKAKLAATPTLKSQIIDITIQVESIHDYQTTPIKLSVDPFMNVKELKKEIYRQYGFPPAFQRFIIANRLGEDDDTLVKLRVNEKETVYLYLKAIDYNDTLNENKSDSNKAVQTSPVTLPKMSNLNKQAKQKSPVSNSILHGHIPTNPIPNHPSLPAQRFAYNQGFHTVQGLPRTGGIQRPDFLHTNFPDLSKHEIPPRHFGPLFSSNFVSMYGDLQQPKPAHQAEQANIQGINGQRMQFPEVYQAFTRNCENLFGCNEPVVSEDLVTTPQEIPDEPVNDWTCASCTLKNLPTVNMCTVCDSPRPLQEIYM